MGMERSLMRLMRSQAQAWRAWSSSQRGAAALSSHQAWSSPGRFSRFELSESTIGKGWVARQGCSRGYADSSVQKEDVPLGNVEVLEFGTNKAATTKRFAVGTTAVDVDEVQDARAEEEVREKAKEILQHVGDKIDETGEEAQVRKLHEKLVRTEGIGEVVQELYNNREVDHAEHRTA